MKNSRLLPIVMACLTTMSDFAMFTTAQMSWRSYKRTVMEGFELKGPLLTSKTEDGLTAVECGIICGRRNCVAYSFMKRGSVGICKVGMNPHLKTARKRSKIYYLIDDSNPNASDGLAYDSVPNVYDFNRDRAFCMVNHAFRGNLALGWPSQVSYRRILKLNTSLSTEATFVDMQRYGPHSQRQFISGVGEMMDARPGSNKKAQRWLPTEPNAVSDEEGALVTLNLNTGFLNDVWDTTIPSRLICSNDSTSYRYLPATGKYYKFTWTTPASQAEANRSCKADGGRLALTYGINGSFPVLQAYRNVELSLFWVGGTNAASDSPNIWMFEDGTTINATNKVADAGRQNWLPGEPTAGLYENCILVYSGFQYSHLCYDPKPFLCERDFP